MSKLDEILDNFIGDVADRTVVWRNDTRVTLRDICKSTKGRTKKEIVEVIEEVISQKLLTQICEIICGNRCVTETTNNFGETEYTKQGCQLGNEIRKSFEELKK